MSVDQNIRISTGVPTAGSGTLGDLYLDANSGIIYRRDSGGWTQAASIRGPMGPAGPQGPAASPGSDPVFSTGVNGDVPAPGVVANKFLRDDATWAAPPTPSVFTTLVDGLVPHPGSVAGKILSDNGTWVAGGGSFSAATTFTATGCTAAADLADRFGKPACHFNVMLDFGAVGDGTTDDTTAIQNAVNAAIDAGGGVVYFPVPPARYKVTAPITFQHNAAATGSPHVHLRGENNFTGQSNQGSIIEGNVNGYIFDNNDLQVLTVTGASGNFVVGETISDNPLSQGTTTQLISAVNNSGGNWTLTCDIGGVKFTGLPISIKGNTSLVTGTLTAQVYPNWVLAHVQDLYIQNDNTTAPSSTSGGSGCIRIENAQVAIIEHCFLQGMVGVWAQANSYCVTVRDCHLGGQGGNPAGSIGIVGTQSIINCNFIGWDTCIQKGQNFQSCILGCRFEVNHTAMVLGKTGYGVTNPVTGILVSGNQTERCDTDVDIIQGTGVTVIGNYFSGIVNVAGTGNRNYCVRVRGGLTACTIAGNIGSGNVANYMFGNDTGSFSITSMMLINNQASNGGTGVTYQYYPHTLNDIQWIGNNNGSIKPYATFASLSSSPAEGARQVITDADANFSTYMHAAAGGGANIAPVMYINGGWNTRRKTAWPTPRRRSARR